jgi:hypothetical protein
MVNKKKDSFTTYPATIFIFGIVAIVAIVSLVLFKGGGGIDGALHQVRVEAKEGACADNDPTNDHYIGGMASYGTLEYYDYCRDDYLYQFHCSTSSTIEPTQAFECINGCLNGACLR